MTYSPFSCENLVILLAGLVAFSIPFSIRVNAIVILCVSIIFFSIELGKGNLNRFIKFFKTPLSVLILLQLAIVCFGIFWGPNFQLGLADLERSSFLLACLVLIFQMKDSSVTVLQCLLPFTAGCMTLTLGGLAYVFVELDQGQRNLVFQNGHTYFTDYLDIHPTYLSIYFISIFFLIAETVRKDRSVLKWHVKLGILLLAVFDMAMLFLLRSQMGLIIFVMLIVLYVIVILKRRAWLVAFALFTVGLLVFLLDSRRVATIFDTYGKNVSTALDQRYLVWRGTLEAIKGAPIFGAGTGGEQELINAGYQATGYMEGIRNSYNAHNQYLQFLVRNGILELGFFLVFMVYSFKVSLTQPNYVFLMFNMTVTLIMLAESFLSVQRGIVFFYFFSCVFICLPYKSDARKGV